MLVGLNCCTLSSTWSMQPFQPSMMGSRGGGGVRTLEDYSLLLCFISQPSDSSRSVNLIRSAFTRKVL